MKKNEAITALKDAQLKKGHRVNTRKTYRHWLCRYISGAADGRWSDLQGFLDDLTSVQRVNPKTVKQALNAMVFFYKNVLHEDPGTLNVPKVNPNRNNPTWLHHHEVMDILRRMRGTPRLQAAMIYGTGSRITAMLTLRLKDIDLDAGLVNYSFDKGGKSRTVRLPQNLIPALAEHIEWVRGSWEQDHARGIIAPSPEPSLERKLGRGTFGKLPWYWLWPSQVARKEERWHASDSGLAKALAKAVAESGITKRVTPHTLRHSYATALSERGENIRTIQDQLGHAHVETTEIYTHVTGGHGTASPLDMPPQIVRFPQQTGKEASA